MSGLVHLYYGDGKGKTTAALGLLLRASGAGLRVVLVQFLKGGDTSELSALAQLPDVRVLRGTDGVGWAPAETDTQKAASRALHDQNLNFAIDLAQRGECDLLIFDEAAAACRRGLIDEDALRTFVEQKPDALELVLTGRNPPDWMKTHADYITECVKIRHPFDRKIPARVGIEK